MTTDVIWKHWDKIYLCQSSIFHAPVTEVENVSTYVNKSREVDGPRVISFDASTTADPSLNLMMR